jgi:hypothetical protein
MSVTCEASQFGPTEKQFLEKLLGETIAPGEQVFIAKLRPTQVPDEATRRAALERLNQLMDESHRRAVAAGVTQEEAEAAVDEAMEFVRGRRT